MKHRWWAIVKWLIGAAVLAAIVAFNWDKLREMLAQSHRFDPRPLIAAGGVFLLGALITFLRWYLLVRAQDLPFRVRDAFRLGFIGLFFSVFLPGSIGGDLVKAGLLVQEQRRRTVAIATILVDRVIGLAGLIFLAGVAGLVFWDAARTVEDAAGNRPLTWIVTFVWAVSGILLAGAAVYWVVPWPMTLMNWLLGKVPRIGRVLMELLKAFEMYRTRRIYVILAVLLAMAGHVAFVMSCYLASLSAPGPVPSLAEQWLLIPVGMVIESVPLTPNSLGVGEAVFESLYHLVDPGQQYEGKGILARWGMRMVNWAVALVGLVLYLPIRRSVNRAVAEKEDGLQRDSVPAERLAGASVPKDDSP